MSNKLYITEMGAVVSQLSATAARMQKAEAKVKLLEAERDELSKMLGEGPFVPKHQYDEVCRQRDLLQRDVDLSRVKVERLIAALEEHLGCEEDCPLCDISHEAIAFAQGETND